jgi:hypothetical protein
MVRNEAQGKISLSLYLTLTFSFIITFSLAGAQTGIWNGDRQIVKQACWLRDIDLLLLLLLLLLSSSSSSL